MSKILIVDDCKPDRQRLESIVRDAGCDVITAGNGKDALRKAHSDRPQLIFMDIVMDGMDGYEATRLLTRDPDTEHIPVVFVSSKHQKADRVWARMQGGRDLVSKPYTAQQIIRQLELYT